MKGTQDSACGIGGGACTTCDGSGGQICLGNSCQVKCGPGNCNGCCRADNSCNPSGIDNTSCGQNGAACLNCSASGSFCNGFVAPRTCNNQQSTCPAPYGNCAQGTRTPVTPQLQKVCTNAQLDSLTAGCASGPTTPSCQTALAALPSTCSTCLAVFAHPFEEKTGLFACAASSVSGPCRRAMGCATDCAETACGQCSSSTANQCYALVNGSGECAQYDAATSCAANALSGGLCSQFSYADFGAWFRGVGDAFCGDGP
jgi:hypothetical protein